MDVWLADQGGDKQLEGKEILKTIMMFSGLGVRTGPFAFVGGGGGGAQHFLPEFRILARKSNMFEQCIFVAHGGGGGGWGVV